MREPDILEAEECAERFLDTVKAHHARLASDEHYRAMREVVGFRETAAIRRASMDLTRALAKMRKP